MNLIYLHGLDSDANATKGQLLAQYCEQHGIGHVYRPDLNQPPQRVLEILAALIDELRQTAPVGLIGSSLGGYFATLMSNQTGCAALLLNPSVAPHVTLQRFKTQQTTLQADDRIASARASTADADHLVLYTTAGGWEITPADLSWLNAQALSGIRYPHKVAAFIKSGDELLDPKRAQRFYLRHGASVIMQAGGDHRFSDFKVHLPAVTTTLTQLVTATLSS